jgi:hypothetical protein
VQIPSTENPDAPVNELLNLAEVGGSGPNGCDAHIDDQAIAFLQGK